MAVVRALHGAGERAADLAPAAALAEVAAALDGLATEDGGLDAADRALLAWVARMTLAPRTLRAQHLAPLRAAGLSDREIHDVAHVACCFAYMNRLADATGVTLDAARHDVARRWFGDSALADHLAWAAGADGA